jgi:hypothetical protein
LQVGEPGVDEGGVVAAQVQRAGDAGRADVQGTGGVEEVPPEGFRCGPLVAGQFQRATFVPDAYVNDNRREIWGTGPIRAFMAKEFVGDHVTMDVRDVIDHYGDIIVRARYDGTYDKTNLPDELVMTSYFSVRDNKIVSLTVIFNQPSPY